MRETGFCQTPVFAGGFLMLGLAALFMYFEVQTDGVEFLPVLGGLGSQEIGATYTATVL